ncbi:hypothetical protein [Caldalkalibacillus salinus]|uniref:hypothetical protein n=1 Tax=Caldalkalibacillus salinus TaxID=2803787 RepID=UPI001920B9B5|nr:hypothetical protein [Caldalkalibacillus salinus]
MIEYSLSTVCYYEPKSVQDCFQLGVDFKELVKNESLFRFEIEEHSDITKVKEGLTLPDVITRYKYDEVNSVDSFQLKFDPSHFECLYIGANFPKRFEKRIKPITLFIRIYQDRFHTSTMPEQGQYVVPFLETDDEHVKTDELTESQEKYLAQQLRMIQLTGAKCLIAERSGLDMLEELHPDAIDALENNVLYSSVSPKHHWFIYLTEGVQTGFEMHEDMVAYDFHQGQLWVNPNLVVGDVQGVIDRVSTPGYSYEQEWEE